VCGKTNHTNNSGCTQVCGKTNHTNTLGWTQVCGKTNHTNNSNTSIAAGCFILSVWFVFPHTWVHPELLVWFVFPHTWVHPEFLVWLDNMKQPAAIPVLIFQYLQYWYNQYFPESSSICNTGITSIFPESSSICNTGITSISQNLPVSTILVLQILED
jgi:hypothetical protein